MEIQLQNVRLAFPALFEASSIGDGSAKYGAKLIIDPTETKAVVRSDPPRGGPAKDICEAAIKDVAIAKWQGKAKTIVENFDRLGKKPDTFYVPGPYKNRDGQPYQGFEGMHYVSATNASRPLLVDRDGRTQLLPSDGRLYAGCYVNALVSVWAQDNNYGRAIRASLKGVQFLRDGDAFGAGTVAAIGAFDDLSAEADSPPVPW